MSECSIASTSYFATQRCQCEPPVSNLLSEAQTNTGGSLFAQTRELRRGVYLEVCISKYRGCLYPHVQTSIPTRVSYVRPSTKWILITTDPSRGRTSALKPRSSPRLVSRRRPHLIITALPRWPALVSMQISLVILASSVKFAYP